MIAKSIKPQVLLVLALQLLVLLGVVASTLYLLRLRQHDYLILNLNGQLRVITETLVKQSESYLQHAGDADAGLFIAGLRQQVDEFDAIVDGLKTRALNAKLLDNSFIVPGAHKTTHSLSSGPDQAIYCVWDGPSRDQMDETAAVWDEFHSGLARVMGSGPGEPQTKQAAEYVLEYHGRLISTTAKLARAFRSMMESKLAQIRVLNQAAIGIMLLIGGTILFILQRRVFAPIERTVAGFNRVAGGDLDYRVPAPDSIEIGTMTRTFNRLTQRLAALFRLTDRINQATSLDEILRFASEEFPAFLPHDWIGLLRVAPDADWFNLERCHSRQRFALDENESLPYRGSQFERAFQRGKPLFLSSASDAANVWASDPLLQRLRAQGLSSVFGMGGEIAESHHERFDGNGYPHGLRDTEIPLSARSVAIADVFDAVTSKRPYKEAWPVERALDLVREETGRHFDPDVVAAFEAGLPRILAIYDEHKHV